MKIMRRESGDSRWPGPRTICKMGRVGLSRPSCVTNEKSSQRSYTMWTKPEFTEMRFGFEVTMYIYNR